MGAGGVYQNDCFGTAFPLWLQEQHWHISALEFMAIILAVKLWGSKWTGLNILVRCDNAACVSVINSGRSVDNLMQICTREVIFLVAQYDCTLHAIHQPGKLNTCSDSLSRMYLDKNHLQNATEMIAVKSLSVRNVPEENFNIVSDW